MTAPGELYLAAIGCVESKAQRRAEMLERLQPYFERGRSEVGAGRRGPEVILDESWRFGLLDAHPADRPGDHEALDLRGALEDRVGGPLVFGALRQVA